MSRIAIMLLLSAALWSQTIDRTKPPETPPIPSFRLPPVQESKLANGLSLALVEDTRFPLVTVRLAFQAGSKFDPPDLPGVAESTGALLREGTKKRTSRQIAEEMTSIGGSLTTLTSRDTMTLAGSALSENVAKLLDILSDVARNATFPPDEVQLRKQNRKQSLLEQLSQADFQANEKFNEVIFGSHPYARANPTLDSIERLSAEKIVRFRDTYLVPNNGVLIVLGRIPPAAELTKTIEARFGDWARKDLPPPPKPEFPESHRELVVVDRPGSVQADIRVGRLAVTRLSPDYFPLVVGSSILGGGASSRMFNTIREKHGYAYDAHSTLLAQKDAGYFTAVTQVRNDVLGPAMDALLAELDRMAKEPVASSELSNVKNLLSGFFVMRLESQGGLANQLVTVKMMGLPNNYLETYTTRVRSVEPAQIESAARKHMALDRAAIVVVGDAKQIGKALEKFGEAKVTKVK